MKSKLFNRIFLFLIFIFLYFPIATLIVFSFNESRNQYKFAGFTLKWYKAIPDDLVLMEALKNTVMIAILSTVIAVIIGFLSSVGILFLKRKYRRLYMTINNIPLINPDIVTGVGLMMMFVWLKISLGFNTILISHIAFSIPFVVLTVLPKLNDIGQDLINAGLDLGLKPYQIIPKIILPASIQSVITGALIAFTMSIDDFVISYFVTGNGVNNLSIWIFTKTKKGINPTANAVSTIMFIVVITLLVIYYLRQTKQKGDLI